MTTNLLEEVACLSHIVFIALVLRCEGTPPFASNLIMLFTLSRHGDRTPINIIHGDPYWRHWSTGYAQLTVTGAAQLIELGRFVRERYHTFIPPVYHKDQCFFRSSGTHRTLMSSNSFLRGLYQSEQEKSTYIVPPVFSASEGDDHLLKMSRNCPAYRDALHTLLNTQRVTNKVASFARTVKELRTAFPGMYQLPPNSINLLRPSWKICDHVSIWIRHKLPNPPAWLTQSVIDDCHGLIDYKMSTFYSTPNLRRFRGGPLAAHIVRLLRVRANAEFDPNITLPNPLAEPLGVDLMEPVSRAMLLVSYFAHDSTLSALMSHLGIFNGQSPPLASCLLVELHRISHPSTDPSDQFYVKFIYRNFTEPTSSGSQTEEAKQPVALWPPACGPIDVAVRQDYLCPLNILELAIRGTYLLQSQPDQCDSQTELNTNTDELITMNCNVHIFVLGIILIQSILIIFLFSRLRRSHCQVRTIHVRGLFAPFHSHRVNHNQMG